mgnify:CR=1 FL=1
MKTKWTKRLLSGFLSLMMLVCLIPTSALAVELPSYSTPTYASTSEGVTVEAEFDQTNAVVNAVVTISENVTSDNLDINLTDALGEALSGSQAVPGDVCDFNVTVINNSDYEYAYRDNSVVLGTDMYDGSNDSGYTGKNVTTFDGFKVYIGSKNSVYRSYNHALEALGLGLDDWPSPGDFDDALQDDVIASALVAKGYQNGIDDLDDYYVDYYNQTHDVHITNLMEADQTYIDDLFSSYNPRGGQHPQVPIYENNPEVAALGYYYLYDSLINVNNESLASYMEIGSSSYSALNSKFASKLNLEKSSQASILLNAGINFLKMSNCYQGRVIVFGFSFSLAKAETKTSYPALDKKVQTGTDAEGNPIWADADTAAAGTNVNFKLESTVPEDLLNYLNPDPVDPPEINGEPQGDPTEGDVPEGRGEYQLTFHDQMDEAFINPDGFEVKIGDTTLTEGQYTLTQTDLADGCDFEITIDLVALYGSVIDQDDLGVTPITVTYTATLAEGTTAGNYVNEAWVHYPDADSEHDTVTVKTFDITVFKYDQATATGEGDSWTAKGLPGAIFTLYSDEDCTVVVDTATSDNDGYATFTGLDAGTYYLKETAAPEGYVKSDKALEVTITVDTADNTVSVSFANSLIPHTGGMGTTLFSIVGGVLIAMAGTIFVISRRKRRA